MKKLPKLEIPMGKILDKIKNISDGYHYSMGRPGMPREELKLFTDIYKYKYLFGLLLESYEKCGTKNDEISSLISGMSNNYIEGETDLLVAELYEDKPKEEEIDPF